MTENGGIDDRVTLILSILLCPSLAAKRRLQHTRRGIQNCPEPLGRWAATSCLSEEGTRDTAPSLRRDERLPEFLFPAQAREVGGVDAVVIFLQFFVGLQHARGAFAEVVGV